MLKVVQHLFMGMPSLEDIVYRSTLLDAENQPLAAGTTRFDRTLSRGRFWPETEENLQRLLKSTKKLQTEDGTVFDLVKFEHLPIEFPNSAGYFQFEY